MAKSPDAEPDEPAGKHPDKAAAKLKLTPRKMQAIAVVLGAVIILGGCLYALTLWQNTAQNMTQLAEQIKANQDKIATIQAQETPDLTPKITALSTKFDRQIAQLSKKIDAESVKITRVDALENQIKALRTQLDNLTKQLGSLDESGKVTINAAQGEMAALRAELDELGQQVHNLQNQPVSTTTKPVITAETIASLDDLKNSFAPAAHRAIKAENLANAESNSQKFTTWLRSQFSMRSITPKAGNDADAILSRANAALARNDLADAVAELDKLGPDASAAMADWLTQLKHYANVTEGLKK